MKVSFVSDSQAVSGTAVIPVFSKIETYSAAKAYISDNDGSIKTAFKAGGFTGDKGQTLRLYAPQGTRVKSLYCVGCGQSDDFDAEMFAAKVVKALISTGVETLTLHLGGFGLSPDSAARAAVGARLAAYRFHQYRTTLKPHQKPKLKTIKISHDEPGKARGSYNNYYGPVCDGTLTARDLVNEPPNALYPKAYSARIKAMESLGLKVEILGERRMKTMGMNALLGVGVGSERESQLVIMRWNGGKAKQRPVALVGKGVTFDTGGISLKPGANMWDMKGDMGGSAAVVGAMQALAARKAKANVIGVVGLVENMPDGRAQLPGDVVTSMSGQTIEVQNTDAEGRLVLADALWYTQKKFKPKAIIDLATLTGAVVVALGHENAGLYSNSDTLAAQIMAASETSTENTWRLPLSKAYDKLLNSVIADMKNIGGRTAGSVTAAQFLQRFIKDTDWAHLDIAGTAMKPSGRHDPRETTFGTGFGVRVLNRWIADNYEG